MTDKTTGRIPLTPVERDGLEDGYRDWVERIQRSHDGVPQAVELPPVFTAPRAGIEESTVALLTTAGAHLDDQEPFHVATTAGDASWRVLPDELSLSRLRFTHTHYDTRAAEQDANVVLPLDRLHEKVASGEVGRSAPFHVGMMGFNPDPRALIEETGPAVAGLLREAGVDVVVLVPG